MVADKAQAEFEISGHSETHRATISKMLPFGRTSGPKDQASTRMANLESGEVVLFIGFGFSMSLNGNELVLDLRYKSGQSEHAGATGPARS